MADQGVSNERKRELEQMDPFQDALVKGLSYAASHKKQLGLIIGAVVVVCALFSTILYSFKRSELQASQLVAKATKTYGEAIEKDPDPVEGYQAVSKLFDAVLEEYANTSAGRMALVTYAKICFDAKAYDKAYALYGKALDSLGSTIGMDNFILSALGNLALLKNEPGQAKAYFLRIEEGASDLLRDEARFALASIYADEKDMASSLKMYEKLVRENQTSLYRPMAEARISGVK